MVVRFIEKTHLSAKALIQKAKNIFKKVKEPFKGSQGKQKEISISDCLTSALAVFKLKYPSLLQFEEDKKKEHADKNLKNLFGLENTPCDTYMRERLDEVNPRELRSAFTSIFSALQRGKQLEKFVFLDGKYFLLNDGTGFFHPKKFIVIIAVKNIIKRMAPLLTTIKC